MEEKNNTRYILMFVALLLLTVLFTYLFFFRRSNDENGQEITNDAQQTEEADDTLTAEDVLEQMKEATSVGSKVQMSIVSPKEEDFQMSQARMWEAQLDGIETDKGLRAICHWEFYLNQNNEEVLYQEMENRSGVSKQDPTLCGFTSTFIDSRGKLRVKLTAQIQNGYGELLEAFTAESNYTVL